MNPLDPTNPQPVNNAPTTPSSPTPPPQRIDQQDILPFAVKQRNIDGWIVQHGLASALPSNTAAGPNATSAYFATDTNKFYLWNGTAWQNFSVTNNAPTLTGATLNNSTINGSVQGTIALSGTTPTIDLTASANIWTITLSGSTTYSATTNTGKVFLVEVKQGAGTSYTNTWFSGITWVTSGGTAPVQTTTSNGYTVYGFRCTAVNTYLGYLVASN